MKGILFINHSPNQNTVEPIHDEANIPMKNINTNDVMNPRPTANMKKKKVYKHIPITMRSSDRTKKEHIG